VSPLIAGRMIDGVELRELASHKDGRGDFSEFFSTGWDGAVSPAQWSVVTSVPGVLRGMHLHRRHDEGFLLLRGRAHVGLRDIRPGSPTEGVSSLFEFSADPLVYLTFPRGIVHGWTFPAPSIHLQSVSETYGAYGGDDNLGCHWSDPALDIPWPKRPTVVAPRAKAFGSLGELIADTLRIDPGFRY
jgi:dTDP-4-dehydrorhamnose 3,5-epimerase